MVPLKSIFAAVCWLLALLAIVRPSGPQSLRPDLLLFNGHVITMDPKRPTAEAIAVQQDRITWVGSNQEAKKLFGEKIRGLDLGGATVLPGIIDAHTHLVELGKSLLRLNLKDVATAEEAVDRVKKRVSSAAPNEWI